MKTVTTRRLCRAGIIAALYFALTACFGSLAFGPLQIRPSEALCLLPLLFPEAIPGLFVGCLLSNLFSGYGLVDIFFGSIITLIASFLTFFVGKTVKNIPLKVFIGGIIPVLFNALGVPLILLIAGEIESGLTAYLICFAELFITESVWIYALGTPMFLGINSRKNKGLRFFN